MAGEERCVVESCIFWTVDLVLVEGAADGPYIGALLCVVVAVALSFARRTEVR